MLLDTDGYPRLIRAAVIAAAGTDGPVVRVPDFGMEGVGVIWGVMTGGIAITAGHWIGPACVAEITVTAVRAASDYAEGSRVLTWLAAPLAIAFPVTGVPAAVAAKSMLSAIFTLRLAEECVRHFAPPVFTPIHLLQLTGHIRGTIARLPRGEEITLVKTLLAVDSAMGR
ncbi:MAG TPA: hypothetical protein VN969_32475 [Streptosporangiaceae bacterium]|jgi:hypothetical protein|nr:hypothetical protein [Streptosporangiaceae bacterium]